MAESGKRYEGETLTPELVSLIARAKREIEGMIDLYPQGMLLVDEHFKIQRANQGLLELLSYERFEQVLGKNMHEVVSRKVSTGECPVCRAIEEARAGGHHGARPVELNVNIPGKGERRLRFTVVGTHRRSGVEKTPLPAAALVEDITEEIRRDAETIKKGKREAVAELMGALNHRINQSLAVIQGRAQLLLFGMDRGNNVNTDEWRHTLTDIVKHAQQIANILRKAMNLRDYVTQEYVGGTKILDLEQSTGIDAFSNDEGKPDGKNTDTDKT